MLRGLSRANTILVVPKNDAEAVQIIRIARKLGIETLESSQPHGARLEKEKHLIDTLQETGKDTVVIIELPGPPTEELLKEAGFTVWWIDHHRYDDINRMTDPETGKPQKSSLEQFLAAFDITDEELKKHGFDPRMVRGVGAMDRGFIWALKHDGYSTDEIKQVSKYVRELSREARGDDKTLGNERVAEEAWKRRQKVGDYTLVTSDEPIYEIRPVVSLLAAEESGKPTPMIVGSRGGLLIYVQESGKALDLYKKFGGFTFGQDTCWGYNNATTKDKVELEDILNYLQLR